MQLKTLNSFIMLLMFSISSSGVIASPIEDYTTNCIYPPFANNCPSACEFNYTLGVYEPSAAYLNFSGTCYGEGIGNPPPANSTCSDAENPECPLGFATFGPCIRTCLGNPDCISDCDNHLNDAPWYTTIACIKDEAPDCSKMRKN